MHIVFRYEQEKALGIKRRDIGESDEETKGKNNIMTKWVMWLMVKCIRVNGVECLWCGTYNTGLERNFND